VRCLVTSVEKLLTHFPLACQRRRTSLTRLPTRTLRLHRLAGVITPALRDFDDFVGGARRSEISAVRHLDAVGRRHDKSAAPPARSLHGLLLSMRSLQFVGCRKRFSGAVQDALIAREQAPPPPPPSINSPPPAMGGSVRPDRLRPDRDKLADDARTYKDIKDRTRRPRLHDKLLYGTAVRVTNSTRVFSPCVGL